MKITKNTLFKRQITLAEIGENGQEKLQNSTILIVGCGGLGSPVAVNLATSGVGKIHLVDFDTVDISNLHRQIFYSLDDVGKLKPEVLAQFIQKRAPFTEVTFSNFAITKKNVFKLISQADIVVDGTDSLPTKYLLNDACVLKNKPLIYGSLYKFDGYVSTFNIVKNNEKNTANLRDAFPKITTDIPSCEEAGTLNSIVGIIANQQVNEVLKYITGIGKLLTNEILIYNSLENSQLKMQLQSKVSKEEIATIFENENYLDVRCEIKNEDWLISAENLTKQLEKVKIISVISNPEIKYPFEISAKITLENIKKSDFKPQKSTDYVLICKQGNTSYEAVKKLKEKFPETIFLSLIGGIENY